MICFPYVIYNFICTISIIFHRFRVVATAIVALPLLGYFFSQVASFQCGVDQAPKLREFIIYPSPTTPTNYENNLQFVDQFPLMRAIVKH